MYTITLTKRDPGAKAKQLRRFGIVPCVIYGGPMEQSASVQAGADVARQLLRRNREGSRVDIELQGERIPAMIKTVERSNLANEIVHISFLALSRDKRVKGKAVVQLVNKDKTAGNPEQLLYEIEYSALPGDLFDTVEVDLEALPVGAMLAVGDIEAFKSDKIELITAADTMVLKISDRKNASRQSD